MRIPWGITAAAALSVSVMAMLAGCTATDSAAPSATPTSSAVASQTPAPLTTAAAAPEQGADALDSVDTIVVSATQLSLREADSEVASIDLVGTPLDDAVSTLTEVLGEPRQSDLEAASCVRAQTAWAWGDTTRIGTPDQFTDDGTLSFGTNETAVATSDGRSVRIETLTGEAVGDSVAPLDGAFDATVKDDFASVPDQELLSIVYDLVRNPQVKDGDYRPYGASVYSEKGVIEAIQGPNEIKSDC
ncbi:hypothetical protein SOM11_07155 [Frigoribacterium sp. CFBP9039]|uniref:hypothetical protein n=1 Tax=Frigoribacterium sp. CFBP9029 TaxID=3096541 RepID=UPI002A6A847C|nr:hypothetical protein [Frigoribacterium sp. CFBP9039]MDY0945764.1 hypothetical protein [Frigoribacterium sp. CFBP9039]